MSYIWNRAYEKKLFPLPSSQITLDVQQAALPSEDGMKSGKRLGKPWGRVCRTGTYSMYLIVKLTQVRIIVLFRFILLSS